ncbi:MAG: PH domain-containing protein [Myxococcota bacterium]
MSAPRTLRPVRTAFLFPRIVATLVFAVVVTLGFVIGSMASDVSALLLAIPLVWLMVLPMFYGAYVAYTKERYELHPDHLVAIHGGLFSDGRTELDVRNITHVRIRLPWLRYQLFRIGEVRVESAGSAGAEITFEAITEPIQVYEEVRSLMQANGYRLTRSETLHQESPTIIGAATDVVQTALGVAVTLAFFLSGLISVLIEAAPTLIGGLGLVLAAGSAILSLGGLVVRYLDLTRRTYTVYDDTVEYTEGFLTRDNAFIPFENIADASTQRTFVDQLLGLYDVRVSCQGSGSEILFRKLSRGPELKAAIATLVSEAQHLPKITARAPKARADVPGEPRRVAPAAPVVAPEDVWTADLQMNFPRLLVGLLPALLIFPVFLIGAVSVFIRASRTTYRIGPNSMASDYSFVGASQQTFAYDKVTGVQVSRTPFDDWMGTLTVAIWSIGAPRPLVLEAINAHELNLPALLRQCGIPAGDPVQGRLGQSFSLITWLIQNVVLVSLMLIVILLCVIVAITSEPLALLAALPWVVILVLSAVITAWRVQRQDVTFHDAHLEVKTGIVFRSHTYARYDDIKKVETVAVPFTDQGRFSVYVAGEQQMPTGQGGSVKRPYIVSGAYIEDIAARVDAMDALLLGKIGADAILGTHAQDDDVLQIARPSPANTVVPLGLVGILFFPILFGLPFAWWSVVVRRYAIESDRVVRRDGILFRRATSVLCNRIDSLQKNQGALGKIFGNGNVTLMTAGSSAPDLQIAHVPEFSSVYDTIRANYGG